jgi:hypothetical protein
MYKHFVVFLTVVLLFSADAIASDGKSRGSAVKTGDKKTSVNVSATESKKQSEALQLPVDKQESDEPKAGEEINWQVLSSGGGTSSDGSLTLSGTLGQVAVGLSSDGSQDIHHGYWQDFSSPFLCGDANGSGYMDIDDIIFVIDYMFTGGPAPVPLATADVNCSGDIDMDDIVYMIDYMFTGGRDLCDPDDDGIPDC